MKRTKILGFVKSEDSASASDLEILQSKYLSAALGHYQQMKKKQLLPNQGAFAHLVQLAAKKNDYQLAASLYTELRDSVEPNAVVQNEMLKVYSLSHRFVDALLLYRTMLATGQIPPLATYNSLLKMLVNLPPSLLSLLDRVNEIKALCADMARNNVFPQSSTFLILFFPTRKDFTWNMYDCFFESRGTSPRSALLETLFSEGECLNRIEPYEQLLERFSEHQFPDRMAEVGALRSMMKTRNVTPSLLFYNALIRIHSESFDCMNSGVGSESSGNKYLALGLSANIASIFVEMENNGLRPNALTFYPLILNYVRTTSNKRLTTALSLFMLIEFDPDPSVISFDVARCYAAVLLGFSNVRRVSRAEELFTRMLAGAPSREVALSNPKSASPYITAYTTMISLYGMNGQLDRAVALFDSLPYTPRVATYDVLLNVLVNAKDRKAAENRFLQMKNLGFRPTVATYNSMLIVRARTGDVAGVRALMADMRANGEAPDVVSYSTIIENTFKRGDLKQALVYWEEMKAIGIKPNGTIYRHLWDLHHRMGDQTALLALWAAMSSHGFNPSALTPSSFKSTSPTTQQFRANFFE